MGNDKNMLNTSSDSSMKNSDSTRKKLKKLVNDKTMSEIVKNVCNAAVNELKDAERKIERLEDKVKDLQKEKDEKVIYFCEKAQKEKHEKEEIRKLLKKVGVLSFLRCRLELYELLLSNFHHTANLRDRNSVPPNLDALSINIADQTIRESYFCHYNRWWNIMHHSVDPRMNAIRTQVRELFNTYDVFSRYMAILFVHLSNTIHNLPPDVISWENEDEVVSYLQEWNIDDVMELNACRMLYRIPRTV